MSKIKEDFYHVALTLTMILFSPILLKFDPMLEIFQKSWFSHFLVVLWRLDTFLNNARPFQDKNMIETDKSEFT